LKEVLGERTIADTTLEVRQKRPMVFDQGVDASPAISRRVHRAILVVVSRSQLGRFPAPAEVDGRTIPAEV
jgi:hypothetical protein